MKIAVASNDEIKIADHFGKTRGFVIYSIEEGKICDRQFRINDFTGHARGLEDKNHSHDRHSPIPKALRDCDAVISRGMGWRIYSELQNIGIQTLIVDEDDTSEAVKKYIEKRLVNHPEKGCTH